MTFDATQVFLDEFQAAIQIEEAESGYPVSEWFGSGRSTPQKDVEDWLTRGPECLQSFIDWFEQSQAKVWITPDGIPAIELELMAYFGDIPVHIRPDFVLQLGSALVVVDGKTSARVPATLRQLGLYASGIELVYGIRPKYGAHFMFRGTGPKGCPPEKLTYFQRPVPLDGYQYSVPYLTKQIQMFNRARSQGIFIANPGEECRRCGVAQACPEAGGKAGAIF